MMEFGKSQGKTYSIFSFCIQKYDDVIVVL